MERIRNLLPAGKQRRFLLGGMLLWWALSFWYERFVFEPGSAALRPFTYLCVKLLSLTVMAALVFFFTAAFRGRKDRTAAAATLSCALPLFVLVAGFWAVSHAWPIEHGDQLNILAAAASYGTMSGFFFYLTMWVPMIALTLIPVPAFVVVFKILLISLGVGYCIMRLRRLTGSLLVWLLYFPFLIPPGLYLSYNIHRIPMYAVLYLVFSCKLLCDAREGRRPGRAGSVLLCLTAAVLTQWRSEGVYLLVLAPILLWLAYRPALDRRGKALALAVFLTAQLLVQLPQKLDTAGQDLSDRTMPLFEYLITGMERKGLDREKNAADLAIVDRYIDLEALHALNEELGDYCYTDNLILYYGMRPNPSAADKADFRAAMIRIVLHNPGVYLKNQLSAWVYISEEQYHDRKLDELANIFQRLYLPTLWLFAVWIWTLVKKRWLLWFVTSGHLCHMVITTLLLPAAYFKYYYSEYLYAFLTLVLALCFLQRQRRARKAERAA